jgi:signal transduction histidine kinase
LGLDLSINDLEPIHLTQLFKSADDDNRILNRLLKRDELYYEMQVTPIKDEDHKLICIYGTGRDVTEVAKSYLHQQENIQKLKIANEEMALYIKNIDYVMKNGGVRMTNYSPDIHTLDIYSEIGHLQYRMTQTRALALVNEESKAVTQRALNVMDNHTTQSINLTVKTTIFRNNQYLYLYFSFVPTMDDQGRVISYFGMCRDVSDIMTTEKELERKTAQAQEVETIKNAFLHNMSYEIRTPLTSVVGFAELFEREHDPEDEVVFINEIKQSSAHLLRLINDILFLSRLDARMIEFKTKPVDFAAIFEPRCQSCWSNLKRPEVTYEVINPYKHIVLEIDEQNLGIVIDQVAENAALNTTKGQVYARYDYTGDTLVITFQDTGSGIPEDKLQHIFERFNNTDNRGTGLGLPICQEIILQMGGKITIKSEVEKGTIVWIAIPCKVSELERL